MSMRVTIVDNKTGDVLVDDTDVKAIIGAFALEDNIRGVQLLRCSSLTLTATVDALQNILQKVSEEHPEILIIGQMKDLMKKLEGEMGKR